MVIVQFNFAQADEFVYSQKRIAGWNIHYETILAQQSPRKLERALELLEEKLDQVNEIVPEPVKARLHEVPIWLSKNSASGAVYHVSELWLARNKRHVAMAKGIELQNIDHFLSWTREQPMMILHELAHALHHRIFAYNHAEITEAFQSAKRSGLYLRVKRYNGAVERAYALNDEREYFAELTEAYFGRNDYFPFDRDELRQYDPKGYAMVENIWLKNLDW